MAKYQSRPRTVEATRWFPGVDVPGVFVETAEEAVNVIGGRGHGKMEFRREPRSYVVTIHGQRAYLSPGDWVIEESDGLHHYPCTDQEFRARYATF